MKLISQVILVALVCFSCNSDKGTQTTNTNIPQSDSSKLADYRQEMQGAWRWKSDTSFKFVVEGTQGYYLSSASPADTLQVRYLNENCNPGARYDEAARLFIKGNPIYINTWKIVDGRPYKKRCLAVTVLDNATLKMMDTEKGMIMEYIR